MDSVFDKHRCSNRTSQILSILYFPFGIALVIIRLFLTLHALFVACILPKSSVTSTILKNIFGVIGIHVVVQEDKRTEKTAKVLVSNHVSNLDHMVIDFIIPNITPDMQVGFSPMMQWLTGFKDFGTSQGTEVLQNNIKAFVQESKHPVLLHPEKTTTNGSCLLKFSTFPFTMGQVQPIAVQVTRWPMAISASTLTSNIYEDFFWSLFVPYTIYKIKLLPEEDRKENENAEDFAERVRQSIAESLGVPATSYTESDKLEYIKRLKADAERERLKAREKERRDLNSRNIPTGESSSFSERNLEEMFLQVREVLPDTSADLVKQDLRRTKDVDMTIANILEGHVSQSTVPVNRSPSQPGPSSQVQSQSSSTVEVQPSASPGPDKSDVHPCNQKYSAQSFSTSASNRMLSLQERKQRMLTLARQRYKEKHGLS